LLSQDDNNVYISQQGFILVPIRRTAPDRQERERRLGKHLELGLGRLKRRHQHVADIASRLVDVEAHPVRPLALGNDVEIEAVAENTLAAIH
jgi:hypothetical protein